MTNGELIELLTRPVDLARPFTRADLNTDVRILETGEIGTVMNIDLDSGRVLVSGRLGTRWWFKPADLERGRVVETWEPEE